MLLIPAIDLRRGQVVRLFQGRYDREKNYRLAPLEVAQKFVEAGARLIHLVDLDAARTGEPIQLELILKLAREVKTDLEVGGGIRNLETISQYLEGGISRVILGTAAHKDPELVEAALKKFPKKIVIGIDARKGQVAVQGWEEGTEVDAVELAKKYDRPEVGAIIYTEIERDGALQGPDIKSTMRLANAVSVPVIASGGISSIEDLVRLKKEAGEKIAGVIVGKAIYEGKIDLKEAFSALSE